MFIVKLFMGISYYLKISKTAVYIYPFKTNDVKMKTIFSLKVFESNHKSYFSLNECYVR